MRVLLHFAAPVSNPMAERLMLILLCLNPTGAVELIDAETFLQGRFKNTKELYVKVYDGFKIGVWETWYCVSKYQSMVPNKPHTVFQDICEAIQENGLLTFQS